MNREHAGLCVIGIVVAAIVGAWAFSGGSKEASATDKRPVVPVTAQGAAQ